MWGKSKNTPSPPGSVVCGARVHWLGFIFLSTPVRLGCLKIVTMIKTCMPACNCTMCQCPHSHVQPSNHMWGSNPKKRRSCSSCLSCLSHVPRYSSLSKFFKSSLQAQLFSMRGFFHVPRSFASGYISTISSFVSLVVLSCLLIICFWCELCNVCFVVCMCWCVRFYVVVFFLFSPF